VSDDIVLGKAGKFNICVRDITLSSHAGAVLLQSFMEQLGVTEVLDQELRVKQRERGYPEGEAVVSLATNLILGGSCLADLNVLRGDRGTQQLLGVSRVMAPTTAGEYLRKFHIGTIWDLHRTLQRVQARVRPQQTAACCTIDLDSSIYEQASTKKQGSTAAYNGQVGYHPLFAFWEEEGELLFSHLRRGNAHTARKAKWFLRETLKRVPAELPKKLRTDSGFYALGVVHVCETENLTFGITADQTAPLRAAIAALPETDWQDLEKYAVAQVAEFRYRPVRWPRAYRYIVKRELRLTKPGRAEFHYHVFVTNDDRTPVADLLAWHLQHANMENRIKEHKSGFSLEKLPTQNFHANWAYLLIGQLAFNLVAWFKRLILPPDYQQATIKTLRYQVLNVAGKIVRTARQFFLVLSDDYRYQDVWRFALTRLAGLQFT
jgi:hypothetical protein